MRFGNYINESKRINFSTNSFNSSAFIEEDADDEDFGSNLLPKTEPVNDDASLTTEVRLD